MDQERTPNPRKRKHGQRHSRGDDTGPRRLIATGTQPDTELLRPGYASNFIKWWRELETLVGEKYGDIQTIFTATTVDEAYQANIPPVRPTNAQLNHANDPHGIRKHDYFERQKNLPKERRRTRSLKDQGVQLYPSAHVSRKLGRS